MIGAWTINGADLKPLCGLAIASASTWRDMPARRRNVAIVPGYPGEIVVDAVAQEQPRQFVLQGTVVGTDATDARTKLDILAAILAAPSLLVSFNDAATRQISMELMSFVASPPDAQMIANKIPVTITLVAHDPYSYDITATNVVFAGATAIPLGSGPVWPKITVTGGATNPVFSLKTNTGTLVATLGLSIAFPNTDTVVIDMAKKLITRNGVSQPGYLTSGDFFSIDVSKHGVFSSAAWPTIEGSGLGTNATLSYQKAWRG